MAHLQNRKKRAPHEYIRLLVQLQSRRRHRHEPLNAPGEHTLCQVLAGLNHSGLQPPLVTSNSIDGAFRPSNPIYTG
jgi:hypothetical protein